MKTCLESLFFWEKKCIYARIFWVYISEKNILIVKLQVCNLIVLLAAALSNKKGDLLDF